MFKNKTTIWSKMWKSLIALSVVLGIISPGIKMNLSTIALLIGAFIALAIYWHIVEVAETYLRELKEDITFIKTTIKDVQSNMKNKKGNSLVTIIVEIIGAVIMLYVLWLVIKALFFN